MSKGYGDPKGPGMGRGVYSMRENPAPMPKKGSSLNMKSPVQGKDAEMVSKMAKMQMKDENLRGKRS